MTEQINLFTDDEIAEALREYPAESVGMFKKYHATRPELYAEFEKYALQMFRSGRRRYGAQGIVERIRWDMALKYPDLDFKVNNNFRTMYGRLAMYRNPELAEFFERRTIFGIHPIHKDNVSPVHGDERNS